MYLKTLIETKKAHEETVAIQEEEIKLWVDDTEGMSLSHLKELLISVKVLENPYEQAIDHLRGMKLQPRGKGQKQVGFNNN